VAASTIPYTHSPLGLVTRLASAGGGESLIGTIQETRPTVPIQCPHFASSLRRFRAAPPPPPGEGVRACPPTLFRFLPRSPPLLHPPTAVAAITCSTTTLRPTSTPFPTLSCPTTTPRPRTGVGSWILPPSPSPSRSSLSLSASFLPLFRPATPEPRTHSLILFLSLTLSLSRAGGFAGPPARARRVPPTPTAAHDSAARNP